MRLPDTIHDTLASLEVTFRQMADWGIRGFDCSTKSLQILEQLGASGDGPLEKGGILQQVQMDLGDCRRCGLARTRRHIVFGEGSSEATLVFVGEGPGAEEDRTGRPFVGPAGELLTRIIEAMKLTRDQVYICNVVKCRPPGNRNPTTDEMAACHPFLKRQVDAIAPRVICTLGSFAAQTLLKRQAPISKLRGRFHTYNGIKVMPTYHPAYLLRNPDQKRAVWEDMKKIMALLRIPLQ